jgi:hypothetical protein
VAVGKIGINSWCVLIVFGVLSAGTSTALSAPPHYKKATVTEQSGGKKSKSPESSKPPIAGKIYLRVNITSGHAGLNNDIDTYYRSKKDDKVNGLTDEQYGLLVNSPLVLSRVALWKNWYINLFEQMLPAGTKIPTGLRSKINITINKNHKVLANTEWMDPTENQAAKNFQQNLLKKIRGFETASWIAFPEKAYFELVSPELYLGEDQVQLASHQDVDCD